MAGASSTTAVSAAEEEVERASDTLKQAFLGSLLRFSRHVQLSYEFGRVYNLIVFTDFNEFNV